MITMSLITTTVAARTRVPVATILSADQSYPSTHARHIAMYLAREIARFSYPRIGAFFGGRHHSTVMHGCIKIAHAVHTDADTAATVNALRADLSLSGDPFAAPVLKHRAPPSAPPPGNGPARRRCLACQCIFDSAHSGDRKCKRCRSSERLKIRRATA